MTPAFLDLRWPLWGVGVLLLLALLGAFRWDVRLHLPVVSDLVVLGQVLKLHLLLGRHGLFLKK